MPVTVTAPPSVKLNGPQIGELVSILIAAFNYDELAEAVRVGFDLELAVEFGPRDKPLKVVADALVSGLNRRDLVGRLLAVVAEGRPDNQALPQFVQRVQNGTVTAKAQAGIVRDAVGAAAELARADAEARGKLRPFKPFLGVIRQELDRLERYKSLHDCLHTLQLQLTAVARAAGAFPADITAGIELASYVEQLTRLAKAALQRVTGLPSHEDESAWVGEFEQALQNTRVALRNSQSDPLLASIKTFSRLLPEAVRINVLLTMAAKNLRLESLGEAIGELLDLPNGAGRRLQPGHLALQGLTPQLAGLVDAHDSWQRVDKALMAAEAQPSSPPAMRVPRWAAIKPLLARLCPEGTEAVALSDPVGLSDRWEKESDLKSSEHLFIALCAAATHKFYDVDVQLRDLSERLAEILDPLNDLLEAI